ncbi:YadA-like family protein [Pseudomonas agarici]|nr:YadA-like family protein [Pseudomonas agarici]
MVASELASSAGQSCNIKKVGLWVATSTTMALSSVQPVWANTITPNGSCVGAVAPAVTVGRLTTGVNTAGPTDGSGTYSTVAGCNANGNALSAASAYGSFATVSGDGGSAFGFNSSVAKWGSAFGLETVATGIGSTALGFGSNATALNSVAIGGAGGNGTTALSVANSTTASGTGSIAIGSNNIKGAQATGTDAIAIGAQSGAGAASATALGVLANAAQSNAVAIGSHTSASGASSTAIGNGASASQLGTIAIGNGSTASAANAISIGSGNNVSGANSGAIGDPTTITGAGSYSLGNNNIISANNAFALGNNINVAAGLDGAVVLGNNSTVAAAKATPDATINGTTYTFAGGAPVAGGVLSVGSSGNERQISNVAAGQVTGTSTDAVNGSQLFATNIAVEAVGTTLNNIVNNGAGIKYFHANSSLADSAASGLDSVAVGPQSLAGGAQSLAAGAGAAATTDGSVALGNRSSVQVVGGVALGQDSVSDRAIAPGTGQIPVGNGIIRYDTSDATLLGAVSVGKSGEYRQITNVADATDAHDAVTLRQLSGAIGSLSATGTRYFHTNSANPQDSLAVGQEAIAVGPATVVNGDNGIGIGNQATVAQAAPGGIAIGRNTQVQLASGIAIGSEAQAQGEQSLALGAGAMASHAMSIALGSSSITTVGAQDAYAAYGLTAPQTSVGELGVGTALGNRKVTGVAAGSAANDAVNVAQLTEVGDQVAQNTTNITNLGGRVTTIEGNINNITNGGGVKYFHANSTQADSVASGADSIAIGPNAQSSGASSVASGNASVASGTGSVAMGSGAIASADGSVALGQNASDNGRGAQAPYTGKYSNASNNNVVGTVSVGNAATGETRTISNVADGQEPTDAVNVRQLDGAVAQSKQYTDDSLRNVNNSISNIGSAITNVDNRVTQVEDNISKVQNGTDGMFQVNNTSAAAKPSATGVNAVAGGAGSVASGNNSAAVGTNAKATGENSVALGNGATASGKNSTALGANSVADRDNSVSVGATGNERQITNVAAATQGTDAVNLDQLNKSVSNITNNTNAYTDQRYFELKRDLKKQDDILSAGIAGAMAMASLPQPYSPGASMTSIAGASYRGQSALSFGVSRISDNGRWVSKLQATTNTRRDAGVGIGVGYQW